MHAADVIEALPTARPSDDVLSAVRMVTRHHLPGLVVANKDGQIIGCMSSTDLLQLTLPRYVREEPALARVYDEEHADHIAAVLVGVRVGDVVGEASSRIPMARPQATVVELAELMAERSSPLVVVAREQGGTLGVVTANRLLELILDAAGEAT